MTTGPLHWQLLVRSRALDSQLWVAAVCCARDATAGYVAYGHSMLVGPMGNVVAQAQELATIVEGDVVVQQCVEVLLSSRAECAPVSSPHTTPSPPPPPVLAVVHRAPGAAEYPCHRQAASRRVRFT